MNILFIVPYVPGLVRVRPYNLIRSLARRGHQVTLATLVSEEAELADLEKMRSFCKNILFARLPKYRSLYNIAATLPSSRPLQASYCWQPSFARKVIQHVNESQGSQAYDVVHVEHLRGAPYGLALKGRDGRSHSRPPVVWDSVDCISYLFRQASMKSNKRLTRWWIRFELQRTEGYERWLAKQFDEVLVTSPVDKEAFLALSGLEHRGPSIQVLPNGVDLDYFQPGNGQREPATLVVSGKMSYHANITMTLFLLEEVMPRIWNQEPNVQVTIVGKDPPREILALARHPCVRVTGTVQDVSAYLQKSTIAVAPIRYGAGIQNKVLEAMATATPVVTTPQGIAALSVQPDRDLLVAGEPGEFSEKILYLLGHPQERHRIGKSGREFVETHYHWDKIAAQLEEIYQHARDCR